MASIKERPSRGRTVSRSVSFDSLDAAASRAKVGVFGPVSPVKAVKRAIATIWRNVHPRRHRSASHSDLRSYLKLSRSRENACETHASVCESRTHERHSRTYIYIIFFLPFYFLSFFSILGSPPISYTEIY